MDLLYKHVGDNVRSARKKANVTQAKLAEVLNLSTSHFSGMERGNKKFTIAHIVAIARYLEIPASTMLAGLTNEGSEVHLSGDEMVNFPVKQAAQDFCNLIRNCSQEEINAILEVCRIMVSQMPKSDI